VDEEAETETRLGNCYSLPGAVEFINGFTFSSSAFSVALQVFIISTLQERSLYVVRHGSSHHYQIPILVLRGKGQDPS
jgi:hypothetical protein